MESSIYTPLTSNVVTQQLVEHCCALYKLDHHGDHGYAHWMRVLYNGRMLSKVTRANQTVVELFAMLHDTHREDEYQDPDHGLRAGMYAKRLWEQDNRVLGVKLTENEADQLIYALTRHTGGLPEESMDATIATCWDADRLDLWRVGIRPNPQLLCNEYAQRTEVIEEACQRAVTGAS